MFEKEYTYIYERKDLNVSRLYLVTIKIYIDRHEDNNN